MSSTGPAAVLEAAQLCSAAGDHAEAACLLADALITGPADPGLLRALAAEQFSIGWDGCALALLAEAQRVAPDDAQVVADRNLRLREHGRFVEALAVLGSAPRPALRADTYADLGLPVLAAETDPAGRRLLWWRTGGPLPFLRAGRRRLEEQILADLVSTAGPPTPPAADMPALLTRIVNGTAQDRDALAAVRAATDHLDADRPAEAATVLADALRRDSTHPLLLRRAAEVADRLDRPGPALALYRRLAVDPTPVAILQRQCDLLTRMYRLPEAIRFVDALPAEAARARPLRQAVAVAFDAAGLPAASSDAYGRTEVLADWRWSLWLRAGGPIRSLRHRQRLRDEATVAAWTPLPLDDLLGPLTTVPAADLMAAAASAAETLERARRAAERDGEQAELDVLAAAAAQHDTQVLMQLARRLLFYGRAQEMLAWLDEVCVANPNDLEAIEGRLAALIRLGRTREALAILEAMPPAVRAAPFARVQKLVLYDRLRLRALALEAIGPAANTPPARLDLHRRLWWRTGGPLWMVRRRMRDTEATMLAAWQTVTMPLLSTLDSVVPSADPALRAVVDTHTLGMCTRAMLWEHTNAVARTAAVSVAAAAMCAAFIRTATGTFGQTGGQALLIGLAGVTVALMILDLLLMRATRADDRRAVGARAAPLIVAFAAAGAACYQAGPEPRSGSAFVGGTLAGVAVLATARLAAAAACRAVDAWSRRRFRSTNPRAVALTETLIVLVELRQHERRNNLRWRRFWLVRLERIAGALERDLPAAFGHVDPDTHRQLAEGGRGAARAVRQLKFLVAAPASPDAWRRVEDLLRHNAGALATGELGRLRRAEPLAVPAPVRRSRRALAAEILRVAVFAGLPLAVVYAAEPWLRFSGTVHDWAKVIGLGWALLYVLLHLDPTLREKLSTVLSALGQGQAPHEEQPEALARFRDSARSGAP